MENTYGLSNIHIHAATMHNYTVHCGSYVRMLTTTYSVVTLIPNIVVISVMYYPCLKFRVFIQYFYYFPKGIKVSIADT